MKRTYIAAPDENDAWYVNELESLRGDFTDTSRTTLHEGLTEDQAREVAALLTRIEEITEATR